MAKKSTKKKSPKIIPPYEIGGAERPWGGINTATKDNREMEPGETYDSMNWLTGRDKDNIQLRRGQALLGTTRRNIANQHVSGIGVGTRIDGIQVLFYSFARKLMYLNNTTDDTQEVNTVDILPVAANDEDICMSPYSNLAGAFMYLSSPDSSIYKIPVADPGDVIDQETANFHFGYFKFDQSRMVALNRKGSTQNSFDKTGLYLSTVDTNLPANAFLSLPGAPTGTPETGGSISPATYYYVLTVVGPNAVESTKGAEATVVVPGGDSSVHLTWNAIAGAASYNIYRTTSPGTYTTPALIGNVPAPLTSFTDLLASANTGAPPSTTTEGLISIIGTGDGTTKTFSGIFSSGIGAPFTIYAIIITDGNEIFTDDRNGNLVGTLGGTGTINYATGAYSVTFHTAPANGTIITGSFLQENATVNGVADFTDTGNEIFRQDDGGGVSQAALTYQGVTYCLHVLRTWQFVNNSGSFTNLPYFEQIGIPYSRAAFQTGDGVIFLDNSNPANPTFSILEIPPNSTNLTVVPDKKSQKLDLSSYGFATCVVRRWGDYDIIGFQVTNQFGEFQGYNSFCFARNIWSDLWNMLDYEFSCLEEFNGTLVGGDSLSPNVFTLFSGYDDDTEIIDNHWNHAFLNLELEGLKTVGYIHVEGLIQKSQSIQIGIALDNGSYIPVPFGPILGDGPYVNQGGSVGVGTFTLGANIVGGPGSAQIYGNKFEIDIPIHTDKFEYISWQAEAMGIGWAQINKVSFKDIRVKRSRILLYNDPEIDSPN